MTVLDDPFAPQTEADAPVQGKAEDSPVSADTVRPVAQPSSDRIVVTLKGGRDFDAPWIVIHASSVEEADSQLDAKLAALMVKTQNAAKKFVEIGGGAAPAAFTAAVRSGGGGGSNVPAGAQQAPGGETRQCSHGEMVYRTGRSQKDGGTWKAFMCPTPKGTPNQCDPQWIKD